MKREREREKLQSLIDRRALAARYLNEFGIRVDNHDIERLTEKQLLIKLETRHAVCKENRAALKIQHMTRRFIAKQKFLKMHSMRVQAAKRIQHAWRRTKQLDIVSVIKQYKNFHATTIQKYMRGYRVSQQ